MPIPIPILLRGPVGTLPDPSTGTTLLYWTTALFESCSKVPSCGVGRKVEYIVVLDFLPNVATYLVHRSLMACIDPASFLRTSCQRWNPDSDSHETVKERPAIMAGRIK
jgi:hypothetical protein